MRGKPTRFQRLDSILDEDRLRKQIKRMADQEQALNARWVCDECGGSDFASLMLTNDVWEAAGMTPGRSGFLHLTCVEKRLGRRLVKEDFQDCPLNRPILFGFDRGRNG